MRSIFGWDLPPGVTTNDINEAMSDNECECGGTFDEDDKCDSCSSGHDDCEAQECFACFERAIDRAERMAEGDER